MTIKQLSVFIENKKGHLAALTGELKRKNIDIRAIAVFDTTEFGILRLVVNQPDDALAALREAGYAAKVTEVIAVEPEDKTGILNELFIMLDEADVNVEYVYSYVLRNEGMPLIVLKVDDVDAALKTFEKNGVKIAKKEEIYGSK